MSDENNGKGWKRNEKKFFKKWNNFYSKEEDISSDEDTNESDNEEMLFVRIEHEKNTAKKPLKVKKKWIMKGK